MTSDEIAYAQAEAYESASYFAREEAREEIEHLSSLNADLVAAARSVLRMLENSGSGRLADTDPAIELRTALERATGQPYTTMAEELEQERARLHDELSARARGKD